MHHVAEISSSIAALACDDAGRALGVQFYNGREYWYRGVARAVYQAFLDAASPGSYFNTFMKDGYACTRVGNL